MASGLPMIVSNRCGCAPDLVREGRNGALFDPESIDQLAELLLWVSDSEFKRATMGNASSEIISRWGVSRFYQALQSAAQVAITTRRPRPNAQRRSLSRLSVTR